MKIKGIKYYAKKWKQKWKGTKHERRIEKTLKNGCKFFAVKLAMNTNQYTDTLKEYIDVFDDFLVLAGIMVIAYSLFMRQREKSKKLRSLTRLTRKTVTKVLRPFARNFSATTVHQRRKKTIWMRTERAKTVLFLRK